MSIFAVLGFVLVAPVWVYFTGTVLTDVPLLLKWMVQFTLPMALLITGASWMGS